MPPPKIPCFAVAAATIPGIFCLLLMVCLQSSIFALIAAPIAYIAAAAAAFVWVGFVVSALLLKEPMGVRIVGLSVLGYALFIWVWSHYSPVVQ
jgi:hypothetical protein